MPPRIASRVSAVLFIGLAGTVVAQGSPNASPKVVASVFDSTCASCHGASLQGGGAPALKGMAFKLKWGDRGATALAQFIAQAMPPGAAQPLTPAIAQRLAEYILTENGVGAPAAGARTKVTTWTPVDAQSKTVKAKLEAAAAKLTPVTDAMLRSPAGNDWLAWRGSTDSLGYSTLNQINRTNVGRLRLVWSKSLGKGANGINPVEHDGVIFLHGGGKISALDATSGNTIWARDDDAPPRGVSQPRGVALYNDALYVSTVDNHVMALDAKTGDLRWDKVIGTQDTLTAAPLVANGRVFQGGAVCFQKGMRCFMVALDAISGKELWRFDTVPDDGAPGSESWGGAPASQRAGAGVWSGPSYDYAKDTVLFGTGNTYAISTILKNDPKKPDAALYTESTLNLEASTGKPIWYFQHFAGDVWDEDWAYERMIAPNPRGGGKRIVMTMGKLGVLDALDLESGKFLWSYDLGFQDIFSSIDPETGAKLIDVSKIPVEGKTTSACPYAAGVRNWASTSFDPDSGVLFIPALDTCMEVTIDSSSIEGSSWKPKSRPGSDNMYGHTIAVDLKTGKKIWDIARRAPEASAILATAGGLVFEGSRDRWFRALDSGTGQTLWQTNLIDTPNSFPITYSVAGKQYVAIVSGGGTYLDNVISQLTPEIETSVGGPALWVFALDAN